MNHIGTLEIWIPGEPRPKYRPLASIAWGKGGKRVATVRDHPNNVANEAFIKDFWREFVITNSEVFRDFEFPLSKDFCFACRTYCLYKTPKTPKRKKVVRPKITPPDVDNLEKLVYDALNNELWKDDGAVFSAWVGKYYFSDTEGVLCVVEVYEVDW